MIDISNNHVNHEGVEALSSALLDFKHGLIELNLFNCSLSSRSTTTLLQALTGNFGLSLTIKHLNLSFNSLEEGATGCLLLFIVIYCYLLFFKLLTLFFDF